VYYSKDVNSTSPWPVEDDDSLEAGNAKDTERLKRRMLHLPAPSHFRARGKESKGFMGSDNEAVA
jgi:hypothetical protein